VARIDLLTIGEAFEDLVFFDLPRLPEAGEEMKTSRFTATIGGGAVITAIAAARLGLRTAIVSGLQTSAVRRLRADHVRVRNVKRPHEPHAITGALSTPRDRTFVTFNGVNDWIEPRLAAAAGRLTRAGVRHVHFALAPARCDRWVAIVNRLRALNITTSWDFGWHPFLRAAGDFRRLLSRVDVLFVNEAESKLYAPAPAEARTTVIKLGARGSRWISDGTDTRVAAPRVRAVDTTGAGDAFNGGFLTAYLGGGSPRDCLRFGNEIGARSTLAPGGIAGLPTRSTRPARPARP